MFLMMKIFFWVAFAALVYYIVHTTLKFIGYVKAWKWAKQNNITDIVGVKIAEE